MDDDGMLTQYSQAPLDLDELLQMHEANPENVDLVDCIAFRYYTADDLDKAAEFYKKILGLDGDQASAHYYLGNIHFRRKQLVAAMMAWKRVIQLQPESKLARNAQERVELALEKVRELK